MPQSFSRNCTVRLPIPCCSTHSPMRTSAASEVSPVNSPESTSRPYSSNARSMFFGRVPEIRIRMDDHLDRQAVLGRELEVALIVGRHGHHRAGAVFAQHEVRDPDRNAFAR